MNSKPSLNSRLIGLDVFARIEEFKLLKTGWLDGKGLAPCHDGLDWLSAAFDRYFPDDLRLPYLYPTAEGGVRVEWTVQPREVSLEIDLIQHVGFWHSLNMTDGAEQFRSLNMDDPDDWEWLIQEICRPAEAKA